MQQGPREQRQGGACAFAVVLWGEPSDRLRLGAGFAACCSYAEVLGAGKTLTLFFLPPIADMPSCAMRGPLSRLWWTVQDRSGGPAQVLSRPPQRQKCFSACVSGGK